MAHHTVKSGYNQLVDRLNRFPQGAPPSDVLYQILKMLFSEQEAGLAALLPIKPFTVEKAARIWRMAKAEARDVLDELAGRAILLDIEDPTGQQTYILPPPMAGFFEFSMMRIRGDINQKVLGDGRHSGRHFEVTPSQASPGQRAAEIALLGQASSLGRALLLFLQLMVSFG